MKSRPEHFRLRWWDSPQVCETEKTCLAYAWNTQTNTKHTKRGNSTQKLQIMTFPTHSLLIFLWWIFLKQFLFRSSFMPLFYLHVFIFPCFVYCFFLIPLLCGSGNNQLMFLIMCSKLRPSMMQHLLRRLVFDVPLLNEHTKMPLKVRTQECFSNECAGTLHV